MNPMNDRNKKQVIKKLSELLVQIASGDVEVQNFSDSPEISDPQENDVGTVISINKRSFSIEYRYRRDFRG